MYKFSNNFFNNIRKKIFLYSLILFYCFAKLQSLNHNLPPYYFYCDEGLFSDEVFRMLNSNSSQQEMFKSGPLNIIPIFYLYKIYLYLFNVSQSYTDLIIFGRAILSVGLNVISIIYLDKILNLFFEKKSSRFINFGLLLYVLSPYLFAQTRIWYPDSYQLVFTFGLIYYIFKTKIENFNQRNLFFIVIFISLLFSAKYTGVFLAIPAVFVLLEKFRMTFKNYSLNKKFFEFLKYFLISVAIFSSINYSILLNFEQFLIDFYFNLNNYGGNFKFSWRLIEGVKYYSTFLFIIPFSLFSIFYQIISFYKFIKDKKYFEAFMFFILPISFCVYLGGYYLIINRNINFLIPLIVIPICIGIKESFNFQYLPFRIFNFLNLTFMFVFIIISFSITLLDDFKVDSRTEMQNYLIDEFTPTSIQSVGVNEGCTGNSPADGLYITEVDRNMDTDKDAYLFNSHWSSAVKIQKQNILFVTNHKNTHFDYYLNFDLFNNNYFTQNKVIEVSKNYQLKKVFDSNGPKMMFFIKK